MEQRKSITPDIIKSVYNVARRNYEKEIPYDDTLNYLINKKGMNFNSAKMYLGSYFAMREGKNFKFTMRQYAYEYYLSNIVKDDGKEALKVALLSFRKHLDSNENWTEKKSKICEDIYNKFLQQVK